MSIQRRSPDGVVGVDTTIGRDRPIVSIVVVTYGSGPVVLDALDAVEQNTAVAHEVIVVDNPPEEGRPRTAELLRRRAGITLVESDENLGFAGANNLGAQHAAGEILCFLNPDAMVGSGWLEPLIAALDDPAVAIAAPVLVDADGSLQEAGQLIYDDGCTAAVGGPEVFNGDWTQAFSRDVDYASAACWVLRRAEFSALGGFDERYHPAYFEDADYALRVEAGGQRSRLVADAPIVHLHGKGGSVDSSRLGERSREVFCSIWGSRLGDQPPRPRDDDGALRNRDRLAEASVGWIADTRRCPAKARSSGLADARRHAIDHPRNRIVFVTDDARGLDVLGARRDGVEVAVGDVEAIVKMRPPDITWHGCDSHAGSIRALWSPWAAFVFVAGIAIRWLLFDTPAAVINADEAYSRIETFEILRGQFPIVLGGTVYTLPVEGYLYTPFTYLFNGANVVPLKLLSTLSWLGTAVTLFFVGRRLIGERAGLIAASLLWITPGSLMVLSITAYPAYASGMLVVSLAFLTAVVILDAAEPSRRLLVAFGVLAGFAFWLHPMFLTVMLPMTVVVLWTIRRRVDGWVSVIGGGIVGCLPLLLWNAVNGWPSLESPVEVPGTYTDRLRTFAVDLLPRAFGLRDSGLNWYHSFWGPVLYLALLATIGFGLFAIARWSSARGRVVLFAVLGAVFFLMAFLQNLIYANDGRYAMISLPFVLTALAAGIDRLAGWRPPWRVIGVFTVVAAVWLVGFVRPNQQPFLDARGVDPNAQLDQIVDVLDERGINRIYGSYWGVLPVDFAGDNRIVSGVFPFWPIRFPDRQRLVGATPPEDVAVIYMTNDEDLAYLLMPVERYERIVIGDRIVYLPLPGATAAAPEG
jgi:GT2 family glycosyltransferase